MDACKVVLEMFGAPPRMSRQCENNLAKSTQCKTLQSYNFLLVKFDLVTRQC